MECINKFLEVLLSIVGFFFIAVTVASAFAAVYFLFAIFVLGEDAWLSLILSAALIYCSGYVTKNVVGYLN